MGAVQLGTIFQRGLDLLYPPRCGGCDRRGTLLCSSCRVEIASHPPAKLRPPAGIDAVVVAGLFAGPLRLSIHKLKFESDTPLARALAGLLHGALIDAGLPALLASTPPVVMPVPSHVTRHRERGYDPAALIASELAKLTGWPLGTGLVRIRPTRSQVGLHHEERRENVRGAFEWRSNGVPPETVLLVDDVLTTGATSHECALVLKAAGVRRVVLGAVGRAAGSGPNAGS